MTSSEQAPVASSRRTVVGAALLDDLARPQRMLVARRKPPKALAGYWEFPGGKVEAGESEPDALRRELFEELGIRTEIFDRINAPNPDAGWPLDNGMSMQVYTASIVEGDPKPLTDHDLLEWVALDSSQLIELNWIPADRPIVTALLRQLGIS